MKQKMSKATERLSGQPMFQILTEIKERERSGIHVSHFEIGDPDFDTPSVIIEAAKKALSQGYTHYSDSIGDYEFRKAICETRFFTPSFEPDIGQVIVTPGANILIYYAVRCLAEEGDEVIIPNPSFSTYKSVLNFCDVNIVEVPLREKYGFCMQAADVEAKITEKTKLIIINSPHNPTGAVMDEKELEKIGRLCLEKGIYLYCDEIYSYLNYTGKTLYSPAVLDKCKERMILATGFSKAFAMTGWRLGVGIAPQELIKKMGLLLETTSSCVPAFIQHAGITAIKDAIPDVLKMVDIYKERRELLVQGLNQIAGIHCEIPEGAFYVFPNISELGLSSREFAKELLYNHHVAVCPGSDFGSAGEGYVRLCYAASLEEIRVGLERIRKFANFLVET